MAGPHPLFERRDVAGENLNVIFSAGKTEEEFCSFGSCTVSNFGNQSQHFRILWAKVTFLTTTVPVPSASAQSPCRSRGLLRCRQGM